MLRGSARFYPVRALRAPMPFSHDSLLALVEVLETGLLAAVNSCPGIMTHVRQFGLNGGVEDVVATADTNHSCRQQLLHTILRAWAHSPQLCRVALSSLSAF